MNDKKMSKQGKVKGDINRVVAAVAGAVVGAGIAVAGVALSDEKNRGKIRKVVKDATNSIDKTTKKVNKAVKSL
ncbi:MAG: hypothetical protein Q8O88_00640 [bacterium]|nr:hypothetical protein [bacterium]